MARTRVTPEQLRHAAVQFKQASRQSLEMVTCLESAMCGLQQQWEGMAQEPFYGDYEQWQTQMTQFIQLLQSIGDWLYSKGDIHDPLDMI